MKKNDEIRFPFDNQFMFAKVMGNQPVCREFIQRLFSDRKVTEVKDLEIADVTTEATVIPGVYSKSVRFDVLFGDDESWYNIEMQVAKEDDLPQRGRYYSSALDVAHLEKGKPYRNLKQSFVIFICRFDYYNKREAIYTFERFDKKLQLPYSDGSYIIMLNTKCPEEKVPEEFRSFFHYINTSEVDTDDWFVEMIHQLVLRYQSDEEVARVATLEEEFMRKEILAEERGHANERVRLNKLTVLLAEQGRMEDLLRGAQEPEFQRKLLKEFGLTE